MAKRQYIKDLDDNIIYPITHEQCVVDSEGTRLSTKMSSITSLQNNMSDVLARLSAAVSLLDGRVAVVGWDGESEPTIANIPEGVDVEYDGTTYTGTMKATDGHMGEEVLVFDGTSNFDRYVVVLSGSEYSWIKYGTTGINLEDYKRKDEEVWLTEQEFAALAIKDATKVYNVYEEVTQL